MCYFLREATSEIYGPRVYYYHIRFEIYFYSLLFLDLLFQKPQNTLLRFFVTYFITLFIEIYLSNLSQFYPVDMTISYIVTRKRD